MQTPSPTEGEDGIEEGNGEAQEGTPSPTEGEDGIEEGNGEGGTPSPTEGVDGTHSTLFIHL